MSGDDLGNAVDPRSAWPIAAPLAALCLGFSIQARDGLYSPSAIAWLVAAALALGIGLFLPASNRFEWILPRLMTAIIVAQAAVLIWAPATIALRDPQPRRPAWLVVGIVGVAFGAVSAAWLSIVRRRRGTAGAVTALFCFAVVGASVLRASPSPYIDTFVQNRDSAKALLSGDNPYAITFPDIYGGTSPTYPPGALVGGRLQFGYVYPPLSLLWITPAHALLGDYRYALLAALLAGAALMCALHPVYGPLAAGVLLTTPRGLYVLEMGWTEPLLLMLLAASVWCAARLPLALPAMLGLFVASKQHLPLLWPLIMLLLPWPPRWRDVWSLTWRAGGMALAVSLPLVLWDARAFWHSAVDLQFRLPFREDALSLLVLIDRATGVQWPAWVGFIGLATGLWLAIRRLPATPAGFAAAVAVTLLPFFALNKQAFCNYYWLVIGALCCAMACGECQAAHDASPD